MMELLAVIVLTAIGIIGYELLKVIDAIFEHFFGGK